MAALFPEISLNAVYTESAECGFSCEDEQVWCQHMNTHQEMTNRSNMEITHDGENTDDMSLSDQTTVYSCLECEKVYKTKSGMSRHVKIHHSFGKGFPCKICSEGFGSKLELKTHLLETHAEEPNLIKCIVCYKIFADKASLSQHFKIHRTDRPFKCSICTNTYKAKRDLVHHEKGHSENRGHCCNECGKSFFRANDLKRHKKTHSDLKPFNCHICSKAFRTAVHLKIHMKHHTNAHDFECFICEKKFAMKAKLKRHLVSHKQIKQFPCPLCDKGYHFKYKLSNHIKSIHNNERPHECEHCDKTFTTKQSLKIHTRTHSKEHPYQCSVCARTFTQLSNKKRHEKVHNVIKEFKCSV